MISNTVAVKIIDLGKFTVTGAIFIFPFTYILSDILTEVYGYKGSRPIIWAGFCAIIFMALMYTLVGILPAAPFWQEQESFETILGQVPRVVVASLLGYLAGSFSNSFILSRMKVWMKGRYLFVRTIGSTIIGEGVDSIIFILVGFAGIIPDSNIMTVIISSYLIKLGIEVVVTPITYRAVSYLKSKEKIDTYDTDISYNPFKI